MEIASDLQNIRLRLGAPETAVSVSDGDFQLNVAADHLGGAAAEAFFEDVGAERFRGRWFQGLKGRDLMGGIAAVDVLAHGSLEASGHNLYRELLEMTRGLSLYRVWNFIPQINRETNGVENYHSFNAGRQRAFGEFFGQNRMEDFMPAASAVGTEIEATLAIAFLAGKGPVEYFENPRQTPAYRYPPKYGPCSPSFARGAVTTCERGRVGYLSGTSSISGHETVGEGSLRTQFDETLKNMRSTLARMGFDGALENGGDYSAQYRVYLRDPEDYRQVSEWFSEAAGEAGRIATFLKADICRRPLKLEIEGVFYASSTNGRSHLPR